MNYYEETGTWSAECIDIIKFTECFNEEEIDDPTDPQLLCLEDCMLDGASECVNFYRNYGYWSEFCKNLLLECECTNPGPVDPVDPIDTVMLQCAEDCINPNATDCYMYFYEHNVWPEGCAEIMKDCGCYDPNNELDCNQKALNYIRKELQFNPMNACAVFNYVQTHFDCAVDVIVRPHDPEFNPHIELPEVSPGGNDNLPQYDGPYNENIRKPIWWYHTDHLDSRDEAFSKLS